MPFEPLDDFLAAAYVEGMAFQALLTKGFFVRDRMSLLSWVLLTGKVDGFEAVGADRAFPHVRIASRNTAMKSTAAQRVLCLASDKSSDDQDVKPSLLKIIDESQGRSLDGVAVPRVVDPRLPVGPDGFSPTDALALGAILSEMNSLLGASGVDLDAIYWASETDMLTRSASMRPTRGTVTRIAAEMYL